MPTRDSATMRRVFTRELLHGLNVVWPVLSALLLTTVALGLAIGVLEGWGVADALYFTFVSGLTIGYGDLVPGGLLTRVMAVGISICGILLTALVAALAVRALNVNAGGGAD